MPHPILLAYYNPIVPFPHDDFFDSAVGRAVREWNSPLGIPFEALHAVVFKSTQLCSECNRMYSIDGYHDHVTRGRCSNRPGLPNSMFDYYIASFFLLTVLSVPGYTATIPNTRLLTELATYLYDKAFTLFDVNDFLSSPIGRAFREWNSCVGVGLNVWYTISTANVECTSCKRNRSFDGDRAHRTIGDCVGGVEKGKARALEGSEDQNWDDSCRGVMVLYEGVKK
jgi:hypothetical protein